MYARYNLVASVLPAFVTQTLVNATGDAVSAGWWAVAVLVPLLFLAQITWADVSPRPGWSVTVTEKQHAALLADLKSAVKANKMGVVTQAGPTATARKRGISIPENRVVGVFNNDFAVKVLATSTAAMIEAPIRFYVTENTDGTATLSYKIPSHVFAP